MADSDWLAAAFEEHRDHLRAVAYRLLGSMTDADDAVPDTWLRLAGADTNAVENRGSWPAGPGAGYAVRPARIAPPTLPVSGRWPPRSSPHPAAATSRPSSRCWTPMSH